MNVRLMGLTILMVLCLLVGCDEREAQEEFRFVELQGAQSASVDITMGVGKLLVTDGAAALMDAVFVYNVPKWQPEVSYNVSDGHGKLVVSQPLNLEINLGRNRYEWELRFNADLPLYMDVKLGAGDSDLQLGGLALTELNLTMGAGDTMLDLTGRWGGDLDARIRGGVGKATLRLPRQVGVRVKVQGGLGQLTVVGLRREDGVYVNDAYGLSDVTINLDIVGGVGAIDLEVVNE